VNTVKIDSNKTKIIAHRGLSGIERENTCPAFLAAANRSYFGIETDVHTTKDGKFVIIHDETTDRVSLGTNNVNVEENDYDAVKDIILPDLDSSFDRQDIRIPLLSEYIKICKKYEKICVLEVKNHFSEDDIKRLVEEIKALGYIENVTFISFDFENCVNLRKLLPENDVQWLIYKEKLTEEILKSLIDTLTQNKLNLDIYYKLLTKEVIDELHKNGIKVNCWTCDEKDVAEKLTSLGIDYITTNILE
jgi:glycerophosphoryl diester phosphodiesterase